MKHILTLAVVFSFLGSAATAQNAPTPVSPVPVAPPVVGDLPPAPNGQPAEKAQEAGKDAASTDASKTK